MNGSDLSDDALAELLTLTVEVDGHGTTLYRNQLGQIHRVHGPALIYIEGTRVWAQHGRYHRTDGPAIEWANWRAEWFLHGRQLTEQEWYERIKSL